MTQKTLLLNLYIIFAIIMSVIIYYVGQNSNLSDYIIILAIISLIQLIMNIVYLKLFKLNIFSFVGLFIIFLYIFNFGQIFLKGFIPKYTFVLLDVSKAVNNDLFINSGNYCLIITFLFMIGILITNQKKTKQLIDYHNKYFVFCKPLGYILLVISAPIMLYIDINKLIISMSNGYLATYSNNLPGFLYFLGSMFLPAILLLLFAYKNNTFVTKCIFISTIIYKVIFMLGGHRASAIVFIIVLFYVYTKRIEKISINNIIIIIFCAFFIITTLNVVGDIRYLSTKNYSMIFESYILASQNNLVFRSLEEFGGTLYTTSLVLYYYPNTFPYSYGAEYLRPFLTVFPNLGGFLNNVIKENWAFQLSHIVPYIGGSFIAELYCNFGRFSYLFAILFGALIGKFSNKYEQSIISNNYLFIAMYSITFATGLFWIRDTFASIVRDTIWCILLIFLIYQFLKDFTKNKID